MTARESLRRRWKDRGFREHVAVASSCESRKSPDKFSGRCVGCSERETPTPKFLHWDIAAEAMAAAEAKQSQIQPHALKINMRLRARFVEEGDKHGDSCSSKSADHAAR